MLRGVAAAHRDVNGGVRCGGGAACISKELHSANVERMPDQAIVQDTPFGKLSVSTYSAAHLDRVIIRVRAEVVIVVCSHQYVISSGEARAVPAAHQAGAAATHARPRPFVRVRGHGVRCEVFHGGRSYWRCDASDKCCDEPCMLTVVWRDVM